MPTLGVPPRRVAVIPCRWGSTRFPGKPLALLAGKPLLWHVHQRCLQATRLDDTVVATDDRRIEAACQDLGIPCLMTGPELTGTDRVAACAERLHADVYINVQGDEPFVSPTAIDAVAEATAQLDGAAMAINTYTPLTDPAALLDHNVVKVVLDADSNVLLYSRQPIPYPRDDRPAYLRQLGLYGLTAEGLDTFLRLKQGPLERAEAVEMLRLVEHGHRVRMLPTADTGIAVDTHEDLARADAFLGGTRGLTRVGQSHG